MIVTPGLAALGSLVAEDLTANPAHGWAAAEAAVAAAGPPADAVAHRIDLVQVALVAGEPKRAQRLIAELQADPAAASSARHLAVLTAWAQLIDTNWYPGNVSSEIAEPWTTITPILEPNWTAMVEMLVSNGPVALLSLRGVIGGLVDNGLLGAAGTLADQTVATLQRLIEFSEAVGQPGVTGWAVVAQAGVEHQVGRTAAAEQRLTAVRQAAAQQSWVALEVLTQLVEADWLATPISSPEGLGYRLGARAAAPVDPAPDLDGAAARLDVAERLLTPYDAPQQAPGLWCGLQLRRATLAWLRGDHPERRHRLVEARAAAERAGLAATIRLLDVHLLLADIAEGVSADARFDVGAGWRLPPAGRLHDLRAWTAEHGSTSWCVGLGRLLERAADQWRDTGEDGRAALAYSGARSLQQASDRLPSVTLATALADLDWHRNLAAPACVRLERLARELPVVADVRAQMFEFGQELEVLVALVRAQRPRMQGASAELAVRALERVGVQLAALDTVAGQAGLPVVALARVIERQIGADDLQTLLDQAGDDGPLLALLAQQVAQLRATLSDLAVRVPMGRGDHARRRGLLDRADQFYDAALEAAKGAESYLGIVVQLAADRRADARIALAALPPGALDDGSMALLALDSGDIARARDAFARTGFNPDTSRDAADFRTAAALALADPDPQPGRALDLARRGAAMIEARIAGVLRETDRVAACDSPDLADLSLIAARAGVALAAAEPDHRTEHLGTTFASIERARSLAVRQSVDPLIGAGEPDPALDTWRGCAAEWAAATDRLLAGFDEPGADRDALIARADAAEASLQEAEYRLEEARPGSLFLREPPGPSLTLAEAQAQLPPGAALLEYHTIGDHLVVAAVTAADIQVAVRTVVSRDLAALVKSHHDGCAAGSAPAAAGVRLAELLLEGVHDVVAAYDRLVVVPFGALTLVPFHALPFGGGPLGLSKIVSYAPSAATALSGGLDRVLDLQRPLVVGDPAFDPAVRPRLPRLAAARIEALAVAARLGVSDPLVDSDATEEAVRGRLAECGVLHLATHGLLTELVPYGSSLVLAGADELTVAELVGLRFGAELAVLSACDTGRGAATLGGDVVGLTRALMAAGVQQTVVSLWPVDDAVACVTMAAFYDGLARHEPPALALQQSQLAVHRLDAAGMRKAYANLAGSVGEAPGTDREQLRRGELEEDDEVPPALSGSSERWWAPFILVG